jgi:hypothetical protein
MDKNIRFLDEHFSALHREACRLIDGLSPEQLYLKTIDPTPSDSCGELVLRSAAIIEQAFGGITANLWDDPFEWTLPETLSTSEKMLEYLTEVEATRRHAFESFKEDRDLSKEIMTPAGSTQLLPFLLDTLRRARHYQQRAAEAFGRLQGQAVITADH